MTWKNIGSLLETIHNNVGHYSPRRKEPPYIVWAEDTEGSSIPSDGKKAIWTQQGTIDLFTLEEFDPLAEQIEDVINIPGISWWKSLTSYEDDTGLIHHEWTWEAMARDGKQPETSGG